MVVMMMTVVMIVMVVVMSAAATIVVRMLVAVLVGGLCRIGAHLFDFQNDALFKSAGVEHSVSRTRGQLQLSKLCRNRSS